MLDLEMAIQNLAGYFPLIQDSLDRFKVDCPAAAGALTFTDELLADLVRAKPKVTMTMT
jgi:hypothetical protein